MNRVKQKGAMRRQQGIQFFVLLKKQPPYQGLQSFLGYQKTEINVSYLQRYPYEFHKQYLEALKNLLTQKCCLLIGHFG